MKKNVVAGLGEVGGPLLQLVSDQCAATGYDINESLMDRKQYDECESLKTEILHVCIPFTKDFESNIIELFNRFEPELIAIHSTIPPYTTSELQKKLSIPILYSATRGTHHNMLRDLRIYTKYFALDDAAPRAKWASHIFTLLMKKCGVKTRRMSDPVTLELAKIVVDTSYYGWLINYAQLSKIIASKHGVDYDEMWEFADEIHRHLGNRPKMFPGVIGGHCLDAGEMLFIKTDMGMRPTTIRNYVENGLQNDVLSYDSTSKMPIFDKVVSKWSRRFSGTMVTLTVMSNRSITVTDMHIVLAADTLSKKFAKDIKVDDLIPFVASLPNADMMESTNLKSEDLKLGSSVHKSIAITPELCRLLGHYIYEGSVSADGRYVEFLFDGDVARYADVYNILKSLALDYTVTKGDSPHLRIKSTSLSLFISDTLGCGRTCSSKCLPEFIYFAPRKHKEQFLAGYLGEYDSSVSALDTVCAAANTILAAGLDILLLSMGRVMTLSGALHTKVGQHAECGTLHAMEPSRHMYSSLVSQNLSAESVELHDSNPYHMLNDNLYMIRTSGIVHETKCQKVYSIDTENHLFVSTGGRLVHNCVIPNLDLVDEELLYEIDHINKLFTQKTKDMK